MSTKNGGGGRRVPFAVMFEEVEERSARGASKKASRGLASWTSSRGVLPVPMTVMGLDVKDRPS